MNIFGSHGESGPQDLPGGGGLDSSSDPIARNPKDIDDSKSQLHSFSQYFESEPLESPARPKTQKSDISRNSAVPALVAVPRQPLPSNNHPQAGSSGAELLMSLLRYKWTILIVCVLVAAPIIAGIWTQIIPEYRARAEVRIEPIIPYLVFRTEDNGAIPRYESFVNTQVSIMRNPKILQRVLLREEVRETQWYKNVPETLVARLRQVQVPHAERLRDNLSVRPRRRTEIIDVSFTEISANDAKVIVNAVLDEYIIDNGKRVSKESTDLYRQLVDRRDVLQATIDGQSGVLAKLRRDLGTGTPEELISGKRVRLDTMKAQLAELRQNIDILEWEKTRLNELEEAARSAADGNDLMTPSLAGEQRQRLYHEDAEWLRLDLSVRAIQHQITNSIYGPNHPGMQKLENTLAFAEANCRQRETQLDEQWQALPRSADGIALTAASAAGLSYEGKRRALEYQLDRTKKQMQLLDKELKEEQGEFGTLFTSAQLLAKENKELQRKRKILDAVEQRIDQKDMERQVQARIEVLTGAFVPSRPDKDRRVVFTAMALVCGLGFGGGVAFLRASRNQTIYSAKDIPQPLQVPFLGHVPLVRTRNLPGKALADEIERNQSCLSESIRFLRTALLTRLEQHGHATILVTSADEGTGKSSFAMMLGKSIARAGRKVLMVDADFYKMTLSKRFDLLDRSGFVDSLSGDVGNTPTTFATKTPNFDVMPVGGRSGNDVAPEEIANGAFKACIDRLFQRHGYDIILLDSSPVLPVADATILAGQVDGTIMVERENVSQRLHVVNALDRLESAGGRLLGTVFVGSSRREHHGYGYGYGYGYGSHGSKSRES